MEGKERLLDKFEREEKERREEALARVRAALLQAAERLAKGEPPARVPIFGIGFRLF